MTRTFNEKIRCQKCGHEQTVETDFERWVRNERKLESRTEGIVRFDLDVLLHKYKHVFDGKGDRTIQCMMFIEVKTFMAIPSESQRDTLSMLNCVLRNRMQNIRGKPRPQMGGQPRKVISKLTKQQTTLLLLGGHLLQLDGSSPENSSLMLWDNQPICLTVLLELMRFERNPDKLHLKMDHRRRSLPYGKMPRFDFLEGDDE